MTQREFKFRAWDKDNQVMVYSNTGDDEYVWHIGSDGMVLLQHEIDDEENHFYPQVTEVEFMQYTGLSDKEGKEIYEGDIFSLGDPKILYVCDFDNGYFGGMQQSNKSRVGLAYWQTDIEIIGNIFETPELLNPTT